MDIKTLPNIGHPVAYYPSLCRIVESPKAAIFFSQLLYWHGEGEKDGWSYKTSEQLEEETGLTYEEQKTARSKLRKMKLVKEHNARAGYRLYFQVDIDKLVELLGPALPPANKRLG